MRVRLNLATKPLETHRRFLAGSGVSAFVGFVVFLVLGWHVYSVRTAAKEMRTRTEKIRQEFAESEAQSQDLEAYFKRKDIASLDARAAFINGIIDSRSLNWTQMFMDLEHILPGGVRVIQIEPKQASGRVEVKLTVGAVSDDAKLNFLHALENARHFSDLRVEMDTAPNLAADSPGGDQKVIQLTTIYSGT